MDADLTDTETCFLLDFLGQKKNQLFKSSTELAHIADSLGLNLLNRFWVMFILSTNICFQLYALISPVSKA